MWWWRCLECLGWWDLWGLGRGECVVDQGGLCCGRIRGGGQGLIFGFLGGFGGGGGLSLELGLWEADSGLDSIDLDN